MLWTQCLEKFRGEVRQQYPSPIRLVKTTADLTSSRERWRHEGGSHAFLETRYCRKRGALDVCLGNCRSAHSVSARFPERLARDGRRVQGNRWHAFPHTPRPALSLRAQQYERAADLSHWRYHESQFQAMGLRGDEKGQR